MYVADPRYVDLAAQEGCPAFLREEAQECGTRTRLSQEPPISHRRQYTGGRRDLGSHCELGSYNTSSQAVEASLGALRMIAVL